MSTVPGLPFVVMAYVKMRGAAYLVRWRRGRAEPMRTCTFQSPEEATAAKALAEAHGHRITAAEVYRAVLGDVDTCGDSPTLAEWIETWIEHKGDIEASTKKEYARLLRYRVVERMGRLRLTEIRREVHIRDLVTWLVECRLAPATVRKHYVVLHEVLRDAVGKHLESNPAEKPKNQRTNGLPKVKRYPAAYLSDHEAQLLIAACGPTLRGLVVVALGTGMRLGELLGLRAGDVDLRREVLYVEQTLSKDGAFGAPKSERSERAISLPASVIEVLRPAVEGKRPGELVFTTGGGHAWSSNNLRRQFWRYAVAKAGRCDEHPPPTVRVRGVAGGRRVDPLAVSSCNCPGRLQKRPRIHDLRHTHVGWLIEARWDFFAIQLRVGHNSIKTTFDIYGHRLPQGDQQRLAALDALLRGKDVHASTQGTSTASAVSAEVVSAEAVSVEATPIAHGNASAAAPASNMEVPAEEVYQTRAAVRGAGDGVVQPGLPAMVFLAPLVEAEQRDPDENVIAMLDDQPDDEDEAYHDEEDDEESDEPPAWELEDLLRAT